MLKLTVKGNNFSKTKKFLNNMHGILSKQSLTKYGELGVKALSDNTPVDTGKTSNSWYYDILESKDSISIVWKNSNIVDGVPIAIILQYGHGTRFGGYVNGIDYINPAMKPVFDKILSEIESEAYRR